MIDCRYIDGSFRCQHLRKNILSLQGNKCLLRTPGRTFCSLQMNCPDEMEIRRDFTDVDTNEFDRSEIMSTRLDAYEDKSSDQDMFSGGSSGGGGAERSFDDANNYEGSED